MKRSLWTNRHNFPLIPLIALAIVGGLLATGQNYAFGTGNHIEQLPIILRYRYPEWLSNDFFTNAASGPGPRMFYALFLAWLSRFVPLEWEFLFLTFLCNVAVILLASLLARELFGTPAGFVMGFLVSFGSPIRLGGAAGLTGSALVPQLFVMPMIVGAIWALMRQKPLLCAILTSVASIFHPLIGIEVGGIFLATLAIAQWMSDKVSHKGTRKATLLAKWIGSVAILAVTALFWRKVMYSSASITSAQFVNIVAYFRHPHHYVPSTFPLKEYIESCLFLIAVMIGLRWVKSRVPNSKGALILLQLIIGLVMLGCVAGALFVEVLPSRLGVTAQTFRLLFLLNLVGQMLVAAGIASFWDAQELEERYDALVLFLSTYAPVTMGIVFPLKVLKRSLTGWIRLPIGIYNGLMTMIVLLYCTVRPSKSVSFVFLGVLFLVAYSSSIIVQSQLGKFVLSVSYLACIGLLLLGYFYPENLAKRLTAKLIPNPILSLSALSGPMVDVARYVHDNTPSDSLFLTPPDWGQFRYLADRAIVIDFKAFPFQDHAIVEWEQRLVDCYGKTTATGFSAVAEMQENYRRITDDAILHLQAKYGFAYAVLYAETMTSFPILFTTDEFQVVRVSH